MRDTHVEDRFELDLRAALRHELATAKVGVAAPQIRGRITARDRSRRTTWLVLLAAALLVGLVAVPVVGALIVERPVTPPGLAEPATVAALDPVTGDLVLSSAWPDGRIEEEARYPGALDLVREAEDDVGEAGDDPATTALHHLAIATMGADGRLAIGFAGGDVVVLPGPGRGGGFVHRSGSTTNTAQSWLGWAHDGRLVIVDDRAVWRIDPATGEETAAVLPERVIPDLSVANGGVARLAWTDAGTVVAMRSDPATFQVEVGTVDVLADRPAFTPGLPGAVVAASGLEPIRAADGSIPAGDCGDWADGCAIVGPESRTDGDAVVTWYVAAAREHVADVARLPGGTGLVITLAREGGDGSVLVADAPGSWRDAIAFSLAGPAFDSGFGAGSYLVGVAPDGRSLALEARVGLYVEQRVVVGDLATGATSTLPAGTVFVGWPTAPAVATDSLPTVPDCVAATSADAATAALSSAGTISPASDGPRPIVGGRADADPWRLDDVADMPALEVDAGAHLALALPPGSCAEVTIAEAYRVEPPPGAVPTQLAERPARGPVVAGLVDIGAPAGDGDWAIRVKLWLVGADREAILLYHVRTTGAAPPVATPRPASAEP